MQPWRVLPGATGSLPWFTALGTDSDIVSLKKKKKFSLSQSQTFYNLNSNKSHLLNLPGGRTQERVPLSLYAKEPLNKGER